MTRNLPKYEQETIINFNEAEAEASIFTHNRAWQKHLEGKLGLKPVMDNGFGGREYVIDKKRIKPPRVPVRLSERAKKERAKRLVAASRDALLSAKTP